MRLTAGGRSRRRISFAALACYKPGHRSRLIYRPRRDDGRRDGRKSFSWRDYSDPLLRQLPQRSLVDTNKDNANRQVRLSFLG